MYVVSASRMFCKYNVTTIIYDLANDGSRRPTIFSTTKWPILGFFWPLWAPHGCNNVMYTDMLYRRTSHNTFLLFRWTCHCCIEQYSTMTATPSKVEDSSRPVIPQMSEMTTSYKRWIVVVWLNRVTTNLVSNTTHIVW